VITNRTRSTKRAARKQHRLKDATDTVCHHCGHELGARGEKCPTCNTNCPIACPDPDEIRRLTRSIQEGWSEIARANREMFTLSELAIPRVSRPSDGRVLRISSID